MQFNKNIYFMFQLMTIKKYSPLVLVCLFCFFSDVAGQNGNVLKDAVATRIVHYFNEKKYDSIYSLYTAETKKLVTPPKTREFFDKFQKQTGPIKEYSYIDEINNQSRFRAVFEKEVYWMVFGESRAEISTLYFVPYDGPTPPKKN